MRSGVLFFSCLSPTTLSVFHPFPFPFPCNNKVVNARGAGRGFFLGETFWDGFSWGGCLQMRDSSFQREPRTMLSCAFTVFCPPKLSCQHIIYNIYTTCYPPHQPQRKTPEETCDDDGRGNEKRNWYEKRMAKGTIGGRRGIPHMTPVFATERKCVTISEIIMTIAFYLSAPHDDHISAAFFFLSFL